ncbi:GIY-YIG nuclease family protein [Tamlana carrageenivorans]|uniref:Excinuclease ABC subunit C n=1 Tax=Pseudotamlana carrageenivorans TaxID=2069432 RepID=A0A2I7SF86_9FLAO|nr:excinuclease ABC subunit C [Tamlana carrageenivorans]
MEYLVYIIFSETLNRYYVGQTKNVDKRLATHNQRGAKYTSKGVPWVLIKTYSFSSRTDAILIETKIKKRGIKRYLEDNS